ncbi:MAG: hypothetical protein NUW37_19735 [Planctomycetes bacterium]|nr:hypothetical protein [Planctomycetota bacterium]
MSTIFGKKSLLGRLLGWKENAGKESSQAREEIEIESEEPIAETTSASRRFDDELNYAHKTLKLEDAAEPKNEAALKKFVAIEDADDPSSGDSAVHEPLPRDFHVEFGKPVTNGSDLHSYNEYQQQKSDKLSFQSARFHSERSDVIEAEPIEDSLHDLNARGQIVPTQSGRLKAYDAPSAAAVPQTGGSLDTPSKREQAVQALQSGLRNLTENISNIAISLRSQEDKAEEMLSHLSTLPESIENSSDVNANRLDGLRKEIQKQNYAANEVALALKSLPMVLDRVDTLPENLRDQITLLRAMERQLERQVNTEEQILDQFRGFGAALNGIGTALSRQNETLASFENRQMEAYSDFRDTQVKTFALFNRKQKEQIQSFEGSMEKNLMTFSASQKETLDTLKNSQDKQLKTIKSGHQKAIKQVIRHQKEAFARIEHEQAVNQTRNFRWSIAGMVLFLLTLGTVTYFANFRQSEDQLASGAGGSAYAEALNRIERKLDGADREDHANTSKE